MELVKIWLCWLNFTVFHLYAKHFNHTVELLQYVNKYHSFSNVILYIGAQLETTKLDDLLEQLHESNANPTAQYIFNIEAGSSKLNSLRNQINDDAVSVLLGVHADDPVWNVMDRRLRRLRQTKVIVVLSASEPLNGHDEQTKLERVFNKLWELQFLQVLVMDSGTVYSYTPYPHIEIFKVDTDQGDPFPPLSANLKGYVVSTPVENDIPRIFCITDAQGQLHIRGFAYQIMVHFLHRLNATLRITNSNVPRSITSSVNMSSILQQIRTRQLEITLHPYTGIDEDSGVMSYPVFKVQNCLIVPVRNEIPRYMYLIRPFEWNVWLLLGVAILYVTFVLSWVSPHLSSGLPLLARIARCFLEGVSQVFFLPSTFQTYAPHICYFLIQVQLAILGFFITSWYSNLLSSFLTTFLVGEQVDTLEQLVATNLPIMIKYYETHLLMQHVPDTLASTVARLLVPVNSSDYVAHLLSFNRSFSYPITEERWTFLALQQQYANKPIYRYSRICFGMPCIGYPMRLDSHLEQPLAQFIMDVQMAGLDHYWLTADFKDALKAGYVHLIDNVLPFKALDLQSVRVAYYALTCGWVVALLSFLLELAVHRVSYKYLFE